VGLDGLKPASLVEELQGAIERVGELEEKLNLAVLDAYGCSSDEEVDSFITNACKREPRTRFPFRSDDPVKSAAQIVQYQIGKMFQRWSPDPLPYSLEALSFFEWGDQPAESKAGRDGPKILVLDEGHPADLVRLIEDALPAAELTSLIQALQKPLRVHLQHAAFSEHIEYYSASGRSAPVYWQLSTPSAGYSVWLYCNTLSLDTLYNLQRDFIEPKLAHEERRLESLRSEFGSAPTAAERKKLSVQQLLVDEIRAFLKDVKLVAPLWKPNLNDGTVINFAPLWRLVPHNKPWQKELKATWDSLCNGEYDWAQIAMHLWPERVVPQCANDRSYAIAHGLENVFWVEADGGKWKPRPTLTRPIDQLVRERTSVAVKAALKELTAASAPNGPKARTRRPSS